MAIQFPDFPMLTREQVSPFGNLVSSFQEGMMFPQQLKAAQLANALNEFKRQQEANRSQYYPRLNLAETLKAEAEPAEMKARTGLYGAQIGKLGKETEWYDREAQARVNEVNAKIQQQKLLQNLLSGKISFGSQSPNQITSNDVPSVTTGVNNNTIGIPLTNNSTTIPNNIDQLSQQNYATSQQQTPQTGFNPDYMKASVAMKIAGMGSPEIKDINGTLTAITPFGNFPVAKGPTEQQKSFQQGIGKASSDAYKANVGAYTAAQNQNIALDDLVDIVNTSPQFRNVTGPIGNVLANWTGTPEQKETLGRIMSSSGEVTLQVAPALKGAFTGRDQNLINSIKANKSDFPDVFIGKLKSQKLVNEVLMARTELANKLMENGVNPIEAHKNAAKAYPLEAIKQKISGLIKHNEFINIVNPETGEKKKVTINEAREKYGVNV